MWVFLKQKCLYAAAACCQDTSVDKVRKYLEYWDYVCHIREANKDTDPCGELEPFNSIGIVGAVVEGLNPLCHVVACSMVVAY